jgi:putative oxygen-independent coproporphyrinogen III oxidase
MIPIIPVGERRESPATHALRAFSAQGGIALAALPPLTLYVHFPWCVKKCPYCDFNSHEAQGGAGAIPEALYLDALNRDLEAVLPLIWGRRVHSVFIGGGTPSLLSESGLDRLLADLRARINLEADAEITLEANPGTAEATRFAAYRASGVNRLSLGVQSLNDAHLETLGRIHDADQARGAMAIAASAFENFNVDLMYALPHQTVDEARQDLAGVLAFRPQHVSLYHLTLEPNTVFAKFPPQLPSEDTALSMQDSLLDTLGAAGYARYEVSAFARPNRQSRHNLNYWHFGDYLGIGPGAHSKLSFANRIVRQTRPKQPQGYLERAARSEQLFDETVVNAAELPFEFFLNALRLIDGVPAGQFSERVGMPLSVVARELAMARDKKLLSADPTRLRATALGIDFLSDLQALFLPNPVREDAPY